MRGFETLVQAFCSCWCLLALAGAVFSTVLVHLAFTKLVPPLVALPTNLDAGLQQTFHFNDLETGLILVRDVAEGVLYNSTRCNYPADSCSNSSLPSSSDEEQNITAELALIQAQFDQALSTVELVANDKYFGIGNFRPLGDNLRSIQTLLRHLQNASVPAPCSTFGPAFCGIRGQADGLIHLMGSVNTGLDSIRNSEAVTQFEEHSERLKDLVHALPYTFWISVLLYLCFFVVRRPTCTGGLLKCTLCSVHVLIFLISFVISALVIIAGTVIVKGAEEVKLEGPFEGEPTLETLVDHVEAKFPEFYDLVLRDLLVGMGKTYQAYLAFTVAHLMLTIHTCSCCCGIYDLEQQKA